MADHFAEQMLAGRDETHGIAHARNVERISLEILRRLRLPYPDMPRIVSLVALLHDVADHKYVDLSGSSPVVDRLRAFIYSYIGWSPEDVARDAKQIFSSDPYAAIEAISYSKENAQGMRYYEAHLSPFMLTVRNIVSDADKITAVGARGFDRCFAYQHEMAERQNAPISDAQALTQLREHAEDKLLTLAGKYARTCPGREMMKEAELEFRQKCADAGVVFSRGH